MSYIYEVYVVGQEMVTTDSLFKAGVLAGCDAEYDPSHRKMIGVLFGGYKNYHNLHHKSRFTLNYGGNIIKRV